MNNAVNNEQVDEYGGVGLATRLNDALRDKISGVTAVNNAQLDAYGGVALGG